MTNSDKTPPVSPADREKAEAYVYALRTEKGIDKDHWKSLVVFDSGARDAFLAGLLEGRRESEKVIAELEGIVAIVAKEIWREPVGQTGIMYRETPTAKATLAQEALAALARYREGL
jgi:hypothetical protein